MMHKKDLYAGQRLVADGGFTCLSEGQVVTVHESEAGELFVRCNEGPAHFLDGQIDPEGTVVGLRPAGDEDTEARHDHNF